MPACMDHNTDPSYDFLVICTLYYAHDLHVTIHQDVFAKHFSLDLESVCVWGSPLHACAYACQAIASRVFVTKECTPLPPQILLGLQLVLQKGASLFICMVVLAI